MFDPKTDRFYYYNVASQKTVWHKPQSCDIIPLAKLQILKQTSEPEYSTRERDRESSSEARGSLSKSNNKESSGLSNRLSREDNYGKESQSRGSRPKLGTGMDKRNSDLLASPSGRHSFQHRLPTVEDFQIDAYKFCKHSGSGTGNSGQGNNGFTD